MKINNISLKGRLEQIQIPDNQVSGSPYKFRNTPLSNCRQSPFFKSRESLFASQTQLQRQDQCGICKTDIGTLFRYCQCPNQQYHDKCIQDSIKLKAKSIFEGAFICDKGCSQEFKIDAQKKIDLTQKGKVIILALLIFIIIFWIIVALLISFWNLMDHKFKIPLIIVLIIIGIVELSLGKMLQIQLYKLYWTVKPIEWNQNAKTSFKVVLPYILKNRDIVIYNYDADQIIES